MFCLGAAAMRPSRQPLRGFLRMMFFLNAIKLNAIKYIRHPEERPAGMRLEGRWAPVQLQRFYFQ
jgi:hypothetical protein